MVYCHVKNAFPHFKNCFPGVCTVQAVNPHQDTLSLGNKEKKLVECIVLYREGAISGCEPRVYDITFQSERKSP